MFIISFHFWFRDLLRELNKKYEVLLIILFLVFLLFLVSEGLLFVSFFWTSFHSLSSPSLGICLVIRSLCLAVTSLCHVIQAKGMLEVKRLAVELRG